MKESKTVSLQLNEEEIKAAIIEYVEKNGYNLPVKRNSICFSFYGSMSEGLSTIDLRWDQ